MFPYRPPIDSPHRINKIKQAINEIKQGKSAGTDGIYPEIIKNLGETAFAWLPGTISDITQISIYLDSGKHAKIIPILNPKK